MIPTSPKVPDVSSGRRDIEPSQDLTWPIAIVVGLLFVVAVNMAFIYIAVSGADEVVESYETDRR